MICSRCSGVGRRVHAAAAMSAHALADIRRRHAGVPRHLAPQPFQSLSMRHMSDGSHVQPPSTSATRSVGKRSKTPSTIRLSSWRLEDLGHADVLLDVVRGPARAGRRVARARRRTAGPRPGRGAPPPRRWAGSGGCRTALRSAPAAAPARTRGVPRRGRSRRRAISGTRVGTTIEARRRGSLSSHSATSQSLTAAGHRRGRIRVVQAIDRVGAVQDPDLDAHGSSTCCRTSVHTRSGGGRLGRDVVGAWGG